MKVARAWESVPPARRRIMAAIKSKGTKPEMVLRKALHAMGYRFRLHRRDLPGCPDLVFPGRKAVILVHGCFWHQHPGCRRNHLPQTRQDYWIPKLRQNVERDILNARLLAESGWQILTIWECELAYPEDGVARASAFLDQRAVQKQSGKIGLPEATEYYGRMPNGETAC